MASYLERAVQAINGGDHLEGAGEKAAAVVEYQRAQVWALLAIALALESVQAELANATEQRRKI
jgi:hypothetical protein